MLQLINTRFIPQNGKNLETVKIAYYYNDSEGQKRRSEENITPDFCLSGVVFFPELTKWDQIKHLTLAQYYHRQLEMFDFVLPADEAMAER